MHAHMDHTGAYPQPPAFGHSAHEQRKALPLAILATLCLFSLLLFVAATQQDGELPRSSVIAFTLDNTVGADDEEPSLAAETDGGAAGSPGEPAPMPRLEPRLAPTDAAPPIVPEAPLQLNFIEPPVQTEPVDALTDLVPRALAVADDAGLSGADGMAGAAGGGVGRGSGGGEGGGTGTGRGSGKGRVLYASWAPTMDHSRNHEFYPPRREVPGSRGR